jgi:hypothetical protein
VEGGPILREVDRVPAKHGVNAFAQTAGVGERQQQPERLVRQPILRVVEEDPLGLEGHALAAAGIL